MIAQLRSQLNWLLFAKWIAANFVVSILAGLLFLLLLNTLTTFQWPVSPPTTLNSLTVYLFVGLLVIGIGGILGIAQALALSSQIQPPRLWITATGVGYVVGYLLSMLTVNLIPERAVSTAIFAAIVSAYQWLILRRYAPQASGWIVINTFAPFLGLLGLLLTGFGMAVLFQHSPTTSAEKPVTI